MPATDLRERLQSSRRALLDAMQGLTEQDFATELAGEQGATVAVYLAALAPAEREAVRRAREAVGAAPRPLPATGRRERVLPPQVIHDLAGARHETLLFLDAPGLDTPGLDVPDGAALAADAGGESVRALLEAVADREQAAAALLEQLAPPGRTPPAAPLGNSGAAGA